MEFVELFIRIAGITLLLVMAGAILRDAWDVRSARFGFFLAITLSAVLASSVSTNSIAPPQWLRTILIPLSSSSAIFIWWYSLSLFDDDFRLGPFEWGMAGLWTVLGALNMSDMIAQTPFDDDWATTLRWIMAVGLVGHIAYVAIAGRKTDLVEGRRRVRAIYACIIAGLFLTDLMTERLFGAYFTPQLVNVVQLSAFLAVIVWSFYWLMRMEKSMLAFERPAPVAAAAEPALTPKETLLHDKLTAAMETDRAYLESDLSIRSLAERIGAPEHQLRALINKSMGHRNFRTFLNGYRMTDAQAALADPEKAATPILTIAMDSGFNSLASFNRAFKQATGKTPSDFRKAAFPAKSADQN